MTWLDTLLEEGDRSHRLQTDLPFFAEQCLKLRPKAGPLEAFVFNPAQQKLHALLEEQRAKTGKIRAVVLKARQMGVSTYVAARLYHRTINNPGLRTIIIGHERRASSNLFQIVKRFHDNLGDELRPTVGTSNAEELIFDRLDSGYIVSVASSEGTGRSATAQLLHAILCRFRLIRPRATSREGLFWAHTLLKTARWCWLPQQPASRFRMMRVSSIGRSLQVPVIIPGRLPAY